jgi:hypothetical protein
LSGGDFTTKKAQCKNGIVRAPLASAGQGGIRGQKKSLTKNLKNSQALEPQTTQLTNQHLIRPRSRHFVQIIFYGKFGDDMPPKTA